MPVDSTLSCKASGTSSRLDSRLRDRICVAEKAVSIDPEGRQIVREDSIFPSYILMKRKPAPSLVISEVLTIHLSM